MVHYLIVCRSLTDAQRTEAVLNRTGIPSRILRSPKQIGTEGCSHSVRIAERHLAPALVVLAKNGLTPKRVFLSSRDSYREVAV